MLLIDVPRRVYSRLESVAVRLAWVLKGLRRRAVHTTALQCARLRREKELLLLLEGLLFHRCGSHLLDGSRDLSGRFACTLAWCVDKDFLSSQGLCFAAAVVRVVESDVRLHGWRPEQVRLAALDESRPTTLLQLLRAGQRVAHIIFKLAGIHFSL